MTNADLRTRARVQLGGGIFTQEWLMGLVACLIPSLLISLAGSIIPCIGSYIVTGPLMFGLSYVFLTQARDQQPINLGDLFKAFNSDFVQYFLLGFMIALFTTLWSFLFVIPGIVKSYSYAMAYYIKIDNPTWDWKTCIEESQKIMNGHKMDLFLLDLSFIGWIILSLLVCGIGVFWVVPYMNAAHVHFYETLRHV